jgi:hypothetical protein
VTTGSRDPAAAQGTTSTTAGHPHVTEEAGLEAGLVAWFADVSRADVGRVGGKGANLGELTRAFACRRGSW